MVASRSVAAIVGRLWGDIVMGHTQLHSVSESCSTSVAMDHQAKFALYSFMRV